MAKIPEFSDDMEIIQKLSDYPDQDMLTTSQFKACFDKAGMLIKAFLNKYVVPAINNYVASQDGLLSVEGGAMKGNISMAGNRVTGLGEPIVDSDSATKKYTDEKLPKSGGTMTGAIDMGGNPVTGLGTPTGSGDAASKSYVDGKHFVVKVNLPSSGWAGDAAPYTQTVSVPGILATDTPHFGNVSFSSDDTSGKIKRRNSFAMIDDLDTADGSVTFTCFEQKPSLSVTVQLEVNR